MEYKYKAFISYSHEDAEWAQWLLKEIESYKVPKELVQSGSPKHLGKVFRDKDEGRASPDLSKQLKEALDASEYLIVVCSPKSKDSKWVRLEIEYFRSLGREDRIIPLLVSGDPETSFPEILREDDKEPLAANVSKKPLDKSTKNNAKLMILAFLLDCNYDDLVQRDKQKRRRESRWLGFAVAMIVALTTLVVSGVVVYRTWYDLSITVTPKQYQAQLEKRLEEVQSQLKKSAAGSKEQRRYQRALDDINSKLSNIDVSYNKYRKQLEEDLKRLNDFNGDIPAGRLWAAKQALAKGDRKKAKEIFQLIREQAENSIKAAAESEYQLGRLAEDDIDYLLAQRHYKEAVRLAPENATYLSAAGGISLDLGLYDKAIAFYEKDLAITRQTLGEQHPSTALQQFGLSLVQRRVRQGHCVLRKVLGHQTPNLRRTLRHKLTTIWA